MPRAQNCNRKGGGTDFSTHGRPKPGVVTLPVCVCNVVHACFAPSSAIATLEARERAAKLSDQIAVGVVISGVPPPRRYFDVSFGDVQGSRLLAHFGGHPASGTFI